MSEFLNYPLQELAEQQGRYAPAARRREQIAHAETLAAEIETGRLYTYATVSHRLTGFRSAQHADLRFTGAELRQDLQLFVARLAESLPPARVEEEPEPVLTLEEVSRQFNVSTKTVSRWRLQGLAARRVLRNGRQQLGFPASAVAAFVEGHRNQVERGSRFRHLTEAEKEQIVAAARALAGARTSLTDASRRIAGQLGRSAEAVRYTIKNYDRANPAAAIFPAPRTAPNTPTNAQITQPEGQPVDLIANRLDRTRTAPSLYRDVPEGRATQLVRSPVDYIPSAEFDDPALEAVILGSMPNEIDFFQKVRGMRPPKDVEAHMAYLYERPLLTREQEAHLFRKMNFLKHQLHQLQGKIDPVRARVAELRKAEALADQVKLMRDLLIECNQRLVHNLATKHLQPGQNLDELKSDANLSLMRAVEKFDYSRGNKFSTYATWAVMKNFARSIPDENTRKQRYMTGHEDVFDGKADIRTDEQEIVAAAAAARTRVTRLLESLDPRTREVIRMRTGLDGSAEMTLEQIGQHFGITKERVRQINVRGMKQLREKAMLEGAEL